MTAIRTKDQWRRGAIASGLRHLTTIGVIFASLWLIARPHAEDFVRDTVREEQFATTDELEQQTKALRDLSARVAKQSDAIEQQSREQSSLKTDIEAIKSLQKTTLNVLLRLERDN